MSPQLRRAVRYVIENPGEIATWSQRHVAILSNLPAPTFARLSKAIGLKNNYQLRKLCRYDFLQSETALANQATALTEETNEDLKKLSFIARQAGGTIINLYFFC